MRIVKTNINDVIILEPEQHQDHRGFFLEVFHCQKYKEAGIDYNFIQDNHSGSKQGTLRGLHYQIKQAQGKLVYAISGEIFDVAVDLRRTSPTFGQHVDCYLSAEKKNQIWIPPGFAHGFLVISEWAEILYKTTDYYAPEWERTLLWNDPDLKINWPLNSEVELLISKKDSEGNLLRDADVYD